MLQPIPFAIASDEAVSKPYSRQRLLNLYAEAPQTRGKSPVLILGRWGLKPRWVAGNGPVRGSDVMGGILYAVSGGALYKIGPGSSVTALGSVGGSGFVIMADNGLQLAIATDGAWVDYIDGYFVWGRDGNGQAYLYDVTTGVVGQITDTDLFLAGDGKFQFSDIGDGADYDALDFATAEKSPDKIIRGIVDRADLLLFGEDTTEPWYNSGSETVFDPQNQTVIPKGILGTYLVARLDNSVFWVGRDPEAGGGAIVYRLNGMEAKRVSTHAVESDLNSVTDWSTTRCISYILNGHAFFHIILPDRASWVYDCATGLWHEQSTFGLGRWRGNSHSYAYGKQIIGSCNSGDLFELDQDYMFDGADTLIEAEMVSVPIGDGVMWRGAASFQVDMQTGVGLTMGQGADPQIMAAYSKDGGITWSNEKWRAFGKIGQYGRSVLWRSWGQFRTLVVKLRITDPVKRAFYNYFADIV